MKISRQGLLSLTILTLGCLGGEPALAQAKLIVTPDALTVTGVRGDMTPEIRTLTIRSGDSVSNIKAYSFDLYTIDRDRIFPQRLITVPPTIAPVTSDNIQNFPVEFNLRDAPSGEFRGDVLLSYQGNEAIVPVIVRVKDPWYLPFALLVLGVILGTTVSSYSRWGKTTDEVTVSLENLRTQCESDKELPVSFASRISTYLVDAKLARDTKQLETAQQSLAQARELWGKWFRQRAEWLAALQVGNVLDEKLAMLSSQELENRYMQALQRDLKHTLTTVANFASPSELAQQINRLSRQQAVYLRVYRQFLDFQKKLDTLNPNLLESGDREQWQDLRDKTTNIKRQLNNLSLSDQPDQPELQALEIELNQCVESLKALQEKAQDSMPSYDLGDFVRGEGKSVKGETVTDEPLVDVTISPTAGTPPLSGDDNPILKGIAALIPNPNQRLQLFSFVGYLTTIAFLAGTGFNQLYLERPTFGADGLRDYFALLAWGFGAEATRSAVTNALRRTDESNS